MLYHKISAHKEIKTEASKVFLEGQTIIIGNKKPKMTQ
jgi:hypothetical protein